ncbi:hypothetical protein NAP1_00935 [Erythrobacter sp. NAP1]|uniref:hypothetical protein n=1 Tax=Erythrobacter sp. NAP1 TaxID=237727 RepID=UPI0000686B85|nr:hypothetical protein [Erythrobacter sp. NAP1]EAQ29293.1 hypothetical protein NAP1_00935 [Erythrobacter sp. NAP1]
MRLLPWQLTFVLAIVVCAGVAFSYLYESGKEVERVRSVVQNATAIKDTVIERPKVGLMTSLPIYWPLEAEFADLASGNVEVPWQREVIEVRFEIVPLDTLSPIPALDPDAPPIDPLEGLKNLAVIQPKGLSPADNVALDEWVKQGGKLLLVLDPLLTGHYHVPLGDPRRPADVALIPPVVARWGLSVEFDEEQAPLRSETFDEGSRLELAMAGAIRVYDAAADCEVTAGAAMVRCKVGEGRVTLLADAAAFEGERTQDGQSASIHGLARYAWE